MYKPLALFIGLRYTRAKRRNHFISFISLISILGIALGVTALITVMSVMNGFEKELRSRMLGMSAHVVISTFYDNSMANWQQLREQLIQHPNVIGAAPYIEGQAMITHAQKVYGALLHGIEPQLEVEVSQVESKMQEGSIHDLVAGEFGVVIGRELAYALRVGVGDKITLVVPQTTVTPVGLFPRMKRMEVKGIFQIGMYEYDSNYVLLHQADAAKLLRLPEQHVHGINLKLDHMDRAISFARMLQNQLPSGYISRDWTHRHANFFKAIAMEKRVMFIILTLIVAVAAFNIVSTLIMVVTDKQADIAILRTLGATPNTIMLIFMVQGTIIGVFGSLFGLFGGISLALNVETIVSGIETAFNIQFLPSDIYYIDDVPSDLRWDDVYRVGTISLLISFLATIYPAWRASKTQPAEALRYE
jgi:lipoprotein-releasing system permease protein